MVCKSIQGGLENSRSKTGVLKNGEGSGGKKSLVELPFERFLLQSLGEEQVSREPGPIYRHLQHETQYDLHS